jgi:Membrane protein involved in the export of O-antigen and teichoic acid
MIVKVLSFLYIPFLKGILHWDGYGVYTAANSIYVFVYVLANSGLPVAISKLVAELVAEGNPKDAIRSFKIARSYLIIAGVVLGLLLALLAGPITFIMDWNSAKLAVIALAPALLFTSISSAYRGLYQGFGNMTPTAVSQVIEQVINTICTLLFAYLLLGKGIEYACAGGTLGTSFAAFVSMVYLLIVSKKSDFKNITQESNIIRRHYNYLSHKIVSYSIPITITVGLTYAGSLVDAWNIKSRLLEAGFSTNIAETLYGQLYAYTSLMNVPIAIITSLSSAIIPAIASAVATQNHKLVQNRINYAMKICLMVSIPAAAGLSILSKPIYVLLTFNEGYELMMYGAFVLIFMSVVQIQNSILQSCGKLFQVIPNLFIGILIKIISNYVLVAIPAINILGAPIGNALGFLIPIILNHRIIKRSLKIKLKLKRSVLSIMLSAIAMAASVFLVYIGIQSLLGVNSERYVSTILILVLSIGLGVIVYSVSLIQTGGITEEDLRIVPARFRKYIKLRNPQ